MEGKVKLTLDDLLSGTKGELVGSGETVFSGVSIDSRTVKEGEVFFAIKGKRFDGHEFVIQAFERGASAAVVERHKIPPRVKGKTIIAVNNTVEALGKLANWVRKRDSAIYIGITGSCGKTTVKHTIGKVLSSFLPVFKSPGNLNNLIGLPLSMLMKGREEVGVFELGISEPGEMERLSRILEPDISIITGIGPSHLEGLGSISAVKREKLKILERTRKMALLNANVATENTKTEGIPIFKVSKKNILNLPVEDLTFSFGRVGYRWNGLKVMVNMPSNTGFYSSAFVLSLLELLGLDLKRGIEELSRLSPLPGRGRREIIGGVIFIDDTYNSNPASLISSLKDLSLYRGRKMVVIGDMLELGPSARKLHRAVGRFMARLDIDRVFLFGKGATAIMEGLEKKDGIFWSESLDSILEEMERRIKEGDAVLVKGSRSMRMERVLDHFKRSKG